MMTNCECIKFKIPVERCPYIISGDLQNCRASPNKRGCTHIVNWDERLKEQSETLRTRKEEKAAILKILNELPQVYSIDKWNKTRSTPARKLPVKEIPKICGSTSCEILANHHSVLAGDDERLSTDFIKSLIFGGKDKCPKVF